MKIAELQAGAETDRLVAEAIGMPHFMANKLDGSVACSHVESSMGTFDDFAPSTALNDAFWAAEQVGLFNDYYLSKASSYRWRGLDGNWVIKLTGSCWPESPFVFGATPEMAICKAILKLKEPNGRDGKIEAPQPYQPLRPVPLAPPKIKLKGIPE